jgi:hypothetical protein
MALLGGLAIPSARTTERVGGRLRVRPGFAVFAVAIGAWLVARFYLAAKADDLFRAQGGDPSISVATLVAPVLALAAWGLAVGVTRQAFGARWPRLGQVAVAVLLAVAVLTHQLPAGVRPWWYPDFAPTPLAGLPWVPADPRLIVLWRLGWLAADLGLVLALARRLPWPDSARVDTPRPPARYRLVVAGLQGAALLALAYTAPLILGEAATLGGAGNFLAEVAPVLVIGALIGNIGRPGKRAWVLLLAFGAALVLDTLAALATPTSDWVYRESPYRLAGPGSGSDDGWATGSASHEQLVLRCGLTLVMIAVLAAGPALARSLGHLEGRPVTALRLGLILNTVDAAATWLGIRAGTVEEANPLVRHGGLGLKWVFVTALLLALWRLRPNLLWMVTGAYAAVVAYHLLGATVLT